MPMQFIGVCIAILILIGAVIIGAIALDAWLTVLVVNHLVGRFITLPHYTFMDGVVILTVSSVLAFTIAKVGVWIQEKIS